jgi:hypothetical protein
VPRHPMEALRDALVDAPRPSAVRSHELTAASAE